MKKLFKARLLKLAAHLEDGDLGHDKFDFTIFHRVNCTSAGCAIGELPTLWPKAFRFGRLRSYFLRGEGTADVYLKGSRKANEDAARIWFDITMEEALHLFFPSCGGENNQKPKLFGGRILGPEAKPAQVAANLRAFVAKKEQAKKK